MLSGLGQIAGKSIEWLKKPAIIVPIFLTVLIDFEMSRLLYIEEAKKLFIFEIIIISLVCFVSLQLFGYMVFAEHWYGEQEKNITNTFEKPKLNKIKKPTQGIHSRIDDYLREERKRSSKKP